jgi:hypothetical protein
VLDPIQHPDKVFTVVNSETSEVIPIIFLILGPCAHLIDLKSVSMGKAATAAMFHMLPSDYKLERNKFSPLTNELITS